MGFQQGNQEAKKGNHKKPRVITQNLIAELQTADGASLRRVVKALIEKAAEGDVAAIREIMDRVDGKVPQPIAGEDGEGPAKLVLEVSWKKPDAS